MTCKTYWKFWICCSVGRNIYATLFFANWLKKLLKAGVKPIKLHALRHSHVAFLIEQNIQPLSIQERLGHANIQITLGTYGHLYAKSDQQVVSAIDNVQEGAILSKWQFITSLSFPRFYHKTNKCFAPVFSVELLLFKMYRK